MGTGAGMLFPLARLSGQWCQFSGLTGREGAGSGVSGSQQHWPPGSPGRGAGQILQNQDPGCFML